METNTLKILLISDNANGGFYHRSLIPHAFINAKVDVCAFDKETKADDFNAYDIVFSHIPSIELVDMIKQSSAKLVVDVDDYWKLGVGHPFKIIQEHFTQRVLHAVKNADLVTTTTQALAEKLKPYNDNVVILPVALSDKIPQYQENHVEHKKTRFALIGSSTHRNEAINMFRCLSRLPKSVTDKMQVVLCGFNGDDSADNFWIDIERVITKDYTRCSKHYADWLKQYKNEVYDGNLDDEFYIRSWSASVSEYAYNYDHIDCLLVPLSDSEFNDCKSELKIVESAYKGVAMIASNSGIWRKDWDGVIKCTTIQDWADAIKLYVESNDIMKLNADTIKQYKRFYDLEDWANVRQDAYQRLLV